MEFASGNIFIREMHFVHAGNVVDGHAHNFDHTTYVIRGAIRIESLNDDDTVKQTIVKKACMGHNWVLIKAGVRHRITALEDDSMGHCIYSHRTPQGKIVQENDGWTPGNY